MRTSLLSLLMLLLCHDLASAADPTLPERIRQQNVWYRLARPGDTSYFMIVQPARSEVAAAKERSVPATGFDGAAIALGQPIRFTAPDDTGGVSEFGAGIKNRTVRDNALSFEVGDQDAHLAWGNFDGKHPEHGYKPFGVAYEWQRHGKSYANTFNTAGPVGIWVRLRQSAKESTWRAVMGPNPELNDVKAGSASGYTADFKVTGTDWQTVPIIYSDKVKDDKGKTATLRPFGSFVLRPGDPGNKVEIAWIRVTDPGNHAYARRTVELPAPVKEASMTLSAWDAEVHVNGKQVAAPWFPLSAMGPRQIDLARHLKPGKNVIAVHALCGYGELMTTGGIRCTDGTFVPLFSWLPMKADPKKGWVRDDTVEHFSLRSSFAAPWKTATLAFRPEDATRFMEPTYDDADWGEVTAITTSGIPGIGPSYFGLIAVDLPPPEKIIYQGSSRPRLHPLFSTREPVVLTIQGLGVRKERAAYTMRYTLVDKQTGKEMERKDLPLDDKNAAVFRRANMPLGAYELRLVLQEGGKTVDERAYEFLVVGAIEQPFIDADDVTAGLKLSKIVDIDCAATPKEGEFGAFLGWDGKGAPYQSKVVEAPFGKFRETGPNNADCFSYRVKVAHPRRPHVLEVTYPDDRWRVHGFFYTEARKDPGNLLIGTNRCSIAVMSGFLEPPSQSMKVARGLFWPVQEEGTVDVYTTRYDNKKHPAAPAAAARIRIFEVDGELPRLRVHDYPGQFKPVGVHTERGSYVMWPTYYGGRNNAGDATAHTLHERPDFYADWHSVASNFVRGLRFHGLNFYVAGQHMYGGTNFPSIYNDNDNGSGGYVIQSQKDWAGILAGVMAENDCGFVSSFEYINNSTIIGRGSPSPAQLARGIPTLVAVTKDGKAYPYGSGIYVPSPLPSYAHADVEAMLLAEVDELIELYKEYPSWKGLNFLLNTLCGPSYGEIGGDPLKIGYEDVAIARFEKETGIKVPVAATDPQRFSKRYDWLLGTPRVRDAWIQWRCDVLLNINRKIRDRLQAVRPDCKLYLNIAYPYRQEEKVEKARDAETLRKHVMEYGWDVRAYQKEKGMVVYTMSLADAEKRMVMSGEAEKAPLARAQALSAEYLQLFANDGLGGVDLHTIFTENWPLAQAGQWAWSGNGAWVGYHWPSGHAFNDFWTNSLIRTNPTLVAYNWHDSNLDSRMEPGLRRFTRAWRSLPNGKYEVLRGERIDGNLSLQRCVDKPQYHYLANPCSWQGEAILTFPKGARVTDVARNQPIQLEADGTWKLPLAPYAVHPFRVEGVDGPAIVALTVRVDGAATEAWKRRVQEEETLLEKLRKEPGGKDVERFAEQVKSLRTALDRGDFRHVEETLRGGYDYHSARAKTLDKTKR